MSFKSCGYITYLKIIPLFEKIFLFLLCFPRRRGKVRDSDEENDPDDEDAIANAVGCLGPFSGLLAPELQKYQKQVKGKEVSSIRYSQCVGSL